MTITVAHWDDFIKSKLPTRHNEYWQYADLSFLTKQTFAAPNASVTKAVADYVVQYRARLQDAFLFVTVNGTFVPALSDLEALPQTITVSDVDAHLVSGLDTDNALNEKQYPFACFSRAEQASGLFISVKAKEDVREPIHLLMINADDKPVAVHTRNVIMLGEEAKVTLVEEYVSLNNAAYLNNVTNHVFLEPAVSLTYIKIQQEDTQATHLATTFVQQLKDSEFDYTTLSMGAKFAREDMVVNLLASGANCKTAGFYRLKQDGQYVDHHIDIKHQAPFTNSEMLYKGILDKKSRAVFNGRLHVESGAQKIVAYQANHHILLANEAEAYSKPELEIYADDVKCKHGATTGQLDQDALFYLRARGIAHAEAMNMLLEGFADEVIGRVAHTGLTPYLRKLVRA